MSTVFAAVRRNNEDGREWVDSSTVEILRSLAWDAANMENMEIPHWAEINPVVRVAEFELREIK